MEEQQPLTAKTAQVQAQEIDPHFTTLYFWLHLARRFLLQVYTYNAPLSSGRFLTFRLDCFNSHVFCSIIAVQSLFFL